MKMWSNGTDYVIAETAEAARAMVMAPEHGGMDAEDALPVEEWGPVPEAAVWSLCDEDSGERENISVCAIIARHVAEAGPVPLYQWSSEW